MNKKSIILIFSLLFSPLAFAFQADVQNVPSDNYFESTLTEINNAKSSVSVFMYLVSVFPEEPESQSNKLLQALVFAQKRGVAVKVILDQNVDFTEETQSNLLYYSKNQNAYEFLKKNEVPVFFDEAGTCTHAKVIIIDEESVILGSTNWSRAAFTVNHEADGIIRSKEFASSLLNELNQIQTQDVPAIATPTVSISADFLLQENLLGEMVTQSDDRAYDVYLYFLSLYNDNPDGKVTLNYDALAQSLSIDKMTREDYRRQINKVLEKLKDKYKLIDFQNPQRNQDADIVLKSIQDPTKPYSAPKENKALLPTTYWKYHWNQTLPLSAKVMYLINMLYSKDSSPSWFMARSTISKRHHISESFISDGTQALRKQNLLFVQYGELEGKSYKDRPANIYTPKPFYNPEDLEKAFAKLESQYGKDTFDKIRQIASIVYEDNDPRVMKTLLDLEKTYGEAVVLEASQKIGDKNPDNPKRSTGYLINTIKAIGKEKQKTQ